MSEISAFAATDLTASCRHWRADSDDQGIVWLCLDKADGTTNVLSRDILAEFETVLTQLRQQPPRGLIIYSGKENGFIAGADINEFPAIDSEQEAYDLVRRGQMILQHLEDLPCSTVAAINGFALGGGLELALACDWRIALHEDRPTLGFPEVQLGLHPGFGGTVRAVRLVGVRHAMSLMLTGKPILPAKARRIGMIDELASADDWRGVATALAEHPASRRRASFLDRLLNASLLRPFLARTLRRQVARRARAAHYPAPYAMVDLWRRHGGHGAAAYDAEARSFAALVETSTSRNLVRVYFLQERLKHAAAEHAVVSHVHVVGAGVMGGDIASWCALRGFTVTLQDRDMQFIQPALDRASKLFEKRLSDPDNAQAARDRLVADVTGEGVPNADLVIEAIFEDREAKQQLYRQLEPRMQPDALLATNTSSIPLEELTPALRDPGRLLGLHFFNPVAKLPLVEVVHGERTRPEAADKGASFTRQIGKLALPCRSHPGFLVNRILGPYMGEAMELAREGVPLPDIDQAAVEFGMPVGPVELADSVGLDVALHVARILAPVIGRSVAPELERLVQDGHLGQKTGQGFYTYQDNRPVKPARPRSVNPSIQDRLVLSLLNEAAACLADGVVADPDLVDAGVIFGTGFAPFRGGPLHYARARGIASVMNDLEELAGQCGERFKPSSGWQRLAN